MANNNYIIYTDGGCDQNPGGNGGYAAVIIKDGIPVYITGYESDTTNQRMELKAVILGLKFIEKPSNIKIFSDSAYVVNCFAERWFDKWIKNKWTNSKKEPVANQDLWETLLKLVDFHNKVEFVKVKGHAGILVNEKCDQLATDIVNFKKELDNVIKSRNKD